MNTLDFESRLSQCQIDESFKGRSVAVAAFKTLVLLDEDLNPTQCDKATNAVQSITSKPFDSRHDLRKKVAKLLTDEIHFLQAYVEIAGKARGFGLVNCTIGFDSEPGKVYAVVAFDPQRTGQQYTVTDFANDNTCNVQLHGPETCQFHVGQDAIMPEIALSSLPIPSEGGCGARLESFEKLPGKALYPHEETPEHDGEHIDVYVPPCCADAVSAVRHSRLLCKKCCVSLQRQRAVKSEWIESNPPTFHGVCPFGCPFGICKSDGVGEEE